jgi:hypothetical protein
MSFLRYVAVVAAAVWVGGLAGLGLAAPKLFAILEARDPADGRQLAALLFGGLFGQFQYVTWALGTIVIVSLALRAALGPRPRRLAIRIWITLAMLAVSVGTMFVIVPRIDRIRSSVTGSIASLPEADSRKQEFRRLHGLANILMLCSVTGGLALLWTEMKDPA